MYMYQLALARGFPRLAFMDVGFSTIQFHSLFIHGRTCPFMSMLVCVVSVFPQTEMNMDSVKGNTDENVQTSIIQSYYYH